MTHILQVNDSWVDFLINIEEDTLLPDPYSKDAEGKDAFVALTQMPKDAVTAHQCKQITDDEFKEVVSVINQASSIFTRKEIERVTAPDFQGRFTEELAKKIDATEDILTQMMR